MERIGGTFPGGPRRRGDPDRSTVDPERAFTRVEDLARRTTDRFLQEKERRRVKRILWGFATILVLAGVVGLYVGISSHRTAEELAREQEAAVQKEQELDLADERKKVLQELWKMETLEKLPTASTSGR